MPNLNHEIELFDIFNPITLEAIGSEWVVVIKDPTTPHHVDKVNGNIHHIEYRYKSDIPDYVAVKLATKAFLKEQKEFWDFRNWSLAVMKNRYNRGRE